MSPAEIVQILKGRNPDTFACLTPQVLGSYIECPEHGPPQWTQEVLKQVGFQPGGHLTCNGALVCPLVLVLHPFIYSK
jgi:hypothetical protein